jgi:hypothetical protein
VGRDSAHSLPTIALIMSADFWNTTKSQLTCRDWAKFRRIISTNSPFWVRNLVGSSKYAYFSLMIRIFTWQNFVSSSKQKLQKLELGKKLARLYTEMRQLQFKFAQGRKLAMKCRPFFKTKQTKTGGRKPLKFYDSATFWVECPYLSNFFFSKKNQKHRKISLYQKIKKKN